MKLMTLTSFIFSKISSNFIYSMICSCEFFLGRWATRILKG